MLEKLPASFGEALQKQRAGLDATIVHRLASGPPLAPLQVRSSVFYNPQQWIPAKYTADGVGISPPLEWEGVPASASQLVIVVEDADSPTPNPLVHAIVIRDDVRESSLLEGALNSPDHTGAGEQTGRNSYLSQAWLPPDPPPGHGPHRYVFQVFALSGAQFSAAPGRHEVFKAIEEHGLAAGHCVGIYARGERDAEAAAEEGAPVGVSA